MARYTDNKGEWFDMWYSDKKCMLSIMYQNMASDLECGYNPLGKAIREQKEMIDAYEKDISATLDMFTEFNDDTKIDHWCYHDLLKRGAIA